MVDNLRTIHINNFLDLNNVVADNGNSLMHILQNMVPSTTDHNNTPLLHPVHNTGRLTKKAMLVQRNLYEDALGQLSNIQNILANTIEPKYHQYVFIPDTPPAVSGERVDSMSSCNYTSFAGDLQPMKLHLLHHRLNDFTKPP